MVAKIVTLMEIKKCKVFKPYTFLLYINTNVSLSSHYILKSSDACLKSSDFFLKVDESTCMNRIIFINMGIDSIN